MRAIRAAWAGVAAVIAVNPLVLPQRSQMEELRAALPEVSFEQPWGVLPIMGAASGPFGRKQFAGELAALVGRGVMRDQGSDALAKDFE